MTDILLHFGFLTAVPNDGLSDLSDQVLLRFLQDAEPNAPLVLNRSTAFTLIDGGGWHKAWVKI